MVSKRQGDQAGGVTSRRRPSTPWGFLGMLGLVILAEWTLNRHDLDYTTPMDWDWRTSGRLAVKKQANAEVLIFGDSLLKFGLMPKILTERNGRTAYNFALHTGQTSSSYFLLRRILNAGYHPRMVILDLTPHMFAHEPEENGHLWPQLLKPSETLDLARTMRDPDFFTTTTLAQILPSMNKRFEIRSYWFGWMFGRPNPSRRGELSSYRRNWKMNDGAQLMPESENPPIDPDFWERQLYHRWSPNPVNVAYLDRFLALAQAEQIAVVWLLPPIQPSIQARTQASGFDADYSRFVTQVADRFPNVSVVDARHSGFEPGEFHDGIHLKRSGALRLSVALGDLLGVGVAGRSWVHLYALPIGARQWAIEDVFQSTVALHPRASGVSR